MENSSNSSSGGNNQNPAESMKKSMKRMNSSNSSEILTKKSKQESGRIEWFFTWFNYTDELIEKFLAMLQAKAVKWAFQEEVCPTTGKLHLQGCFKLRKKARDTEFNLGKVDVQWKKAKDMVAAAKYCLKDDTRKPGGGRWFHNVAGPIEDLFLNFEPKDWQQEVLDIVKTKPDQRSIYWFWEPVGNIGKTVFCKHLALKHDAMILSGKNNDILYGVIQRILSKGDCPLCVFCYPRDYEEFVSYIALEQVKDGMFFSGKFESGMCVFNNPHVIVFANFPPIQSKLSNDRWIVKNITESSIFNF